MSLRPDDRHGRSPSPSPGRPRSRSRSHSRAPSPGPQYASPSAAPAMSPQHDAWPPAYASPAREPVSMGSYTDHPSEQRSGYMHPAQPAAAYPHPAASPALAYPQSGGIQYAQPAGQYNYTAAPANQAGPPRNPSAGGAFQYAAPPEQITFTAKPVVNSKQQPTVRHTPQPTSPPAMYAQPQYTAMPQAPPPSQAVQPGFPPPPMGRHSPQPGHQSAHSHSEGPASYDGRKVVEIAPGGGGKLGAPPSPGLRPQGHSMSGGRPDGLTQRMDRLSVSGNRPDIQTIVPGGVSGGQLPPPSPLLEAYHGTYQSISPMPQAMMLDDDLDHIEPLDALSPRASSHSIQSGRRRAHSSSRRSPSPSRKSKHKDKLALEAYGRDQRDDQSRGRDKLAMEAYGRHGPEREKEKRRVKIYDARDDALDLVDAMSLRSPDSETIINILPTLSHDQMLELRSEYKRHCKVQGRGINIAKHIKLKTSGNFGKIAYVTALGKYESEGYWANYWYQSNSARRELLIEALMGRQNHEMREIEDSFKDKRYSDSLMRCMDKELKADKFRKAVLMALEAERQEESDVWAPEHRERDADMLYKALKAREGGESAMLSIVIMRSDTHLREVLRRYERKYSGNFARDALRKSNNLVGEVIAHILNGVINRPARDAMLLHHALMDLIEPENPGPRSSRDATNSKHERQQRYELLISRLVRLHWDRLHLMRVKNEYEEKYGRLVEEDVEEATKGDFREFCLVICQTER